MQLCLELKHRELELQIAHMQRQLQLSEQNCARIQERSQLLERELAARTEDIRKLTDIALNAAGAERAFHAPPPPPGPEEARPIRRMRDWRQEMEFLEAQTFARQIRNETEAALHHPLTGANA